MDPLSLAAASLAVIQVPVVIVGALAGSFSTARFIVRTYGIPGLWILVFGSQDILRSEFQVLASDSGQAAIDFKKATQDESNMIAVAVC